MRGLQFTEKQIMGAALKQGQFSLTWHYRVDTTRNRCFQLVKKGMLRRTTHSRGVDIWKPTALGRTTPLPSSDSYPRKFIGKWGVQQRSTAERKASK